MTDALLTRADREEALSLAYARAVAAQAGYTTAERDFDRDGVDLTVHAGGAMRPAIDLQLKATINLGKPGKRGFRFPLKRRNYDLLRKETQTPRLLLVLGLPRKEDRWLTVTADRLVLRRAAYWLNLRGRGKPTGKSSVTVYLPEENLFDVNALRDLMDQSSGGRIR